MTSPVLFIVFASPPPHLFMLMSPKSLRAVFSKIMKERKATSSIRYNEHKKHSCLFTRREKETIPYSEKMIFLLLGILLFLCNKNTVNTKQLCAKPGSKIRSEPSLIKSSFQDSKRVLILSHIHSKFGNRTTTKSFDI